MAENLPQWLTLHDAGTPRERYVINTELGSVTVHTHGGQVTAWNDGEFDVLWTSATADYAADKAIRGGVPICFPWFGPGPDGDRKPSHGFARLAPWHLSGWVIDADDFACLELSLSHEDVVGLPGADAWPHRFEATLLVELGERLMVRLVVENHDDAPFTFEAALHTYLGVEDLSQVHIEGLDGVTYVDKVAGGEHTQSGDVTFGAEVDRVYASAGPILLNDASETAVGVTTIGATHTVVWNPGPVKGPDMADVSNWQEFVCIEAAVIGHDAVVLPPYGQHADGSLEGAYALTQFIEVLDA